MAERDLFWNHVLGLQMVMVFPHLCWILLLAIDGSDLFSIVVIVASFRKLVCISFYMVFQL